MTAGVEGLPTDARDRLAEALPHLPGCLALVISMSTTSSSASGPCICFANRQAIAVTLLPVVEELCDEARADELRAAAAALHVQRFNADEEPDNRWPPGVRREVPSFYRGVVMAEHQLRARADVLTGPQQQPTCQQRHTTGTITMCCQQPQGHGADVKHQGSDGSEW